MISTRDLSNLPNISTLKRLCQSLAMLDAIIEPDWSLRYYSFDHHWKPDESLASLRDSSGDELLIWFSSAGAIVKGFAHESAMSSYQRTPPRVWPGILERVPPEFSAFLAEPAFSIGDTTFCIWRTNTESAWQRGEIQFPAGPDPDGSADLLALFDGNPRTYQQWAQDYYERSVDLDAVLSLYNHQPLSQQIVTVLNSELTLADALESAREIGY